MKKINIFILLILCLSLLSGCATLYTYDSSDYYSYDEWDASKSVLTSDAFKENKDIYKTDDDGAISSLYITVQKGVNNELDKHYTFSYLNNYTDSDLQSGEEPYCNVIMTEGTGTSSYGLSLFGFGETNSNGKITIKGSTKKIKTRSYQIKLYKRAGLWNGMKTINLYKNPDDLSRMKQKLCFDSLEGISDIGSLRTGFVRLFVQDTTSDNALSYTDYGIYTFIEQPNKTYMSAHGLDTSGSLYKAASFNFSRYKDILLNSDDKNYNKDLFEKVLNIRQATDHTKLIKMLEVVNDESIPIDDIVGKYFNEDNLLTYAAVNILFSNLETVDDDYLLYSPQNSLTWYLMPGSFKTSFENKIGEGDKAIPEGLIGIGFLKNNVLFRRYFSTAENKKKLIAKIDEIRKTITSDYIKNQTLTYKKSILKYIYSIPEIQLLPRAADYVEPYIDSLPNLFEENYQMFLKNTNLPDSPVILSFGISGNTATFSYTAESKDSGRYANYYIEFSSSSDFSNILFTSGITSESTITVDNIPNVTCFARVVAIDQNSGEKQYSSNIYTDRKGDKYYGCVLVEKEAD